MKMPKRDYFLTAIAARCYLYKQWVLEAFAVTDLKPDRTHAYPYALLKDDGGYFFIGDDKQRIDVVGGHDDGPLFSIYDSLVLAPGDLPNVKEATVTHYGTALANIYLLIYPYGAKFDYIDGVLNPGMFDRIIEQHLTDNLEKGSSDPQAISVEEMFRYNEATSMLCEFTQLCVPAASVKTMTADPRIAKKRQELMEKYKDRLHDPVVQTMIGDELIKIDREWMKGDIGEGFYFKSKSYDVVRKKVFLTQGAEQGFDVSGEMIPESLDEGWDINHLPDMANALREGSYSRGALTAQGGEATKFNYRIFQNTRITEEDCGSTYGLSVVIDDKMKKYYLTNSIIINGKSIELTEENIDKYVGKTVQMRSPAYCKTEGANFCATCMGKRLSVSPEAISTYAADIGSVFMNTEMKKMHGSTMSIAHMDPVINIR